MKNGKLCINCGEELILVASTGAFLEGIDGSCPKCGVMYRGDDPVAVQKGDRIIKL